MKNIRTCIACRTRKNKADLIRIVSDQGVAKIDNKANTRGIYICNQRSCIDKMLKAKNITKCIKIDTTCDSVKELLRNLGE